MTDIYIVDDHAVVIEGLYALLEKEATIRITGYAANAAHCLQYFTHNRADVVLMDIRLPDISGVDLCRIIKKKQPDIIILALTTLNQGTYIRKMMENGARGYLLKSASREQIIEAIKTVANGATYLSIDAEQALETHKKQQNSIPHLTKREKEVLAFLSDGFTNTQIAEKLFISLDTVDSHRKNLHSKLNVNNTAMLIRFAVENNLI
jgi:DNA-binding NarL/FixJ family response regulator